MSASLPTPKSRALRRRWGMVCAGIWLLALVVRLGHLWLLQDSPLSYVLMGDARRYHEWGAQIARGDWLGTETFYQAPLYPYFIGGLYWIFGIDQATVRIAQAVLGATSCILLAYAGRRFFSPKTGLAAGVLFAIYAPAIFYDGIIQKTSLTSFLTCAVLALMARSADRPRRVWAWIGLGIALGALMLTRENALVLVALFPVWLAFGWGKASVRLRIGWLLLVLLGLSAVLFPVALRNRVVGGEWLLTTSQFGTNFYIGNSQFADGRYVPLLQDRGGPEYERIDATRIAEEHRGRKLTPREVSAYWTEMAFEDIHADWSRWFRLMARKWFLIWNATEIIDTEDIYTHAESSWLLAGLLKVAHLGVFAPLACLGIVLAWKSWRRHGILVLFLLAYAASVSLFYVFGRYRFPLVPPLILLAAAGMLRLPGAVRRRQFVRLGAAVLGAVILGYWTNLPGEPRDPMRSNTHYMLAVNLQKDGRDPALIEREYDLAAQYDPNYAEVYRMRGNFERQRGNVEAAIDDFQECVRRDGDFLLGRYDYGLALLELGHFEEALEHLQVVNNWQSDFAEGWLQYLMGVANWNLGRFSAAASHLKFARTLGRGEPAVDRFLARSLMSLGKFEEAIGVFERYLKAEPEDWRSEILLGDCQERLGRNTAALRHWEQALERMPRQSPEYFRVRQKIRLGQRADRLPPRRQRIESNPALRRPSGP